MKADRRHTLGIIGARGHVGAELLEMVALHPALELAYVSSRELAGLPVRDRIRAYRGDVAYESIAPGAVAARAADVVVLALPNGKAAPFVEALGERAVVLDLSADYRFDPAWYYGLPELTRAKYAGQRRISNPGCYATAMQLAIAPLCDALSAPPQCFGVSGYSGAGTTPSDKNDPDKLRDNLIPYALTGHVHEREVTRQLGQPVEFMPHVAPHFRGITMTVNLHLAEPTTPAALLERYRNHYRGEPLVRVQEQPPWVSAIAGRHHVEIGGFAVADGGRRAVLVATLDNLLKGAATQALQNLNRALGLPELEGILPGVGERAGTAP